MLAAVRIVLALFLTVLSLAAFGGEGSARYVTTPGSATTRVDASFRNSDAGTLAVSFAVDSSAVKSAMAEFGYADAELKALSAACSAANCTQAEFDRRVDNYYRDHGFVPQRSAGGSVKLSVDIPLMVRRNGVRVRPLATELGRVTTAKGYRADQTIAAAAAFVQTTLTYRQPPMSEGGRQIAGFYPPPRALELGSGDCDTKSALLAAVMSNFTGTHMVGVHIPGHYLVGVDRVPRVGDAFVEYRGVPYVLVEASGPAMLAPGTITDATQTALNTMLSVRIDPLF